MFDKFIEEKSIVYKLLFGFITWADTSGIRRRILRSAIVLIALLAVYDAFIGWSRTRNIFSPWQNFVAFFSAFEFIIFPVTTTIIGIGALLITEYVIHLLIQLIIYIFRWINS